MYTIKNTDTGFAIFKIEFNQKGNELVDMGQRFKTVKLATMVKKTYNSCPYRDLCLACHNPLNIPF